LKFEFHNKLFLFFDYVIGRCFYTSVFLTSFRCGIGSNRFFKPETLGSQALGINTCFFNKVFFDRISALLGKFLIVCGSSFIIRMSFYGYIDILIFLHHNGERINIFKGAFSDGGFVEIKQYIKSCSSLFYDLFLYFGLIFLNNRSRRRTTILINRYTGRCFGTFIQAVNHAVFVRINGATLRIDGTPIRRINAIITTVANAILICIKRTTI